MMPSRPEYIMVKGITPDLRGKLDALMADASEKGGEPVTASRLVRDWIRLEFMRLRKNRQKSSAGG